MLTIGGHDRRPEYQLQYTVGAFRLSDGRVVIADAGPRELRYYDAEGRHLRTVGGSGQGPGEFSNLRSIARIRGDTIVVWDPVQRRASFFGSNGDFSTGVTLGGWTPVHEELQARYPGHSISAYGLHLLEDGGMVVEPFYGRTPDMMEGTRVIQDTVPLFAFDRTGDQALALGTFPASESFLRNRAGSLLRFGERLVVAGAKDLVYVGSTRDPVIRGISQSGEVVRAIALPMHRRAVTPEDLPARGTGGSIAAHLEAMPVPDSMPVFSALRHGVDGRLWVQKYRAPEDRSQEWLAFGETGDLAASLRIDASMELLDIGLDYVIVRVIDELDVQEVRMHRLMGAPAGP